MSSKFFAAHVNGHYQYVAILEAFDLKSHVPMIAVAFPTIQTVTQQSCFSVEIDGW